MLINKIYYFLKPLIPLSVRLELRRRRAARKRIAHGDVWPIDPEAGFTPRAWPGWPDGKQFAVVLTHDVEGTRGLSRIDSLTKVEERWGFRSSFNFVPENEYRVPDLMRRNLERAGFEVGVHGLYHDGKLYSSKATFASRAAKIRDYSKHWNATGFRSPLMHHRLGWQHLLGAEYDSSVMDTDPFEPEPDGIGTIFPFWVPGPGDSGYVELPCTLTQDHGLFVILQEKSIDIWKKKVDWIAKHGGMVLLNTHPDYMCFGDAEPSRDEFPIAWYEELLCYLRKNYEGKFWSALPRDISRYYCANVARPARNSRKSVCMIAYTGYECDNRVRRYAEELARRGDRVDVIALRFDDSMPAKEVINGVTLHRIQDRRINERHKWDYAWRLLRFLVASSRVAGRLHQMRRYDLVHVHNMPDFLVFAAWHLKWTGAKVILDIHDLVPELFENKFHTSPNGLYARGLRWLERISAAFADHVIVSNHLWAEKLAARSVPKGKCSVYINNVDPALFTRHPRTRDDGKFIILFPGSYQRHQGLDIAIRAFALIKDEVPNAEFHMYGGGPMKEELTALITELGLEGRAKLCGFVTLEKMAGVIANADMGVVPKRADSFGNEAYSTKIMEFMSQGVPVVASRTKIDTYYFDDSTVQFFTSGDPRAMADAMLAVIRDRQRREVLIENGLRYVECNDWATRRADYLNLVDTLSTMTFVRTGETVPAVAASKRRFDPVPEDKAS
jgi:glycosyltransferase involved in cell wall biosynthesis